MTFDELIRRYEEKKTQEPTKTVEVDMSDILDEGVVFVYRKPTVMDLYAVSDSKTLDEWRRRYPDMPEAMCAQLELYARLHVAPASASPIGQLYAELMNRLDTAQALQFIKRIESALSEFVQIGTIAEEAERKKS